MIGNQSPIQYFENLSAESGKPLIFTEIGYANDSGAAADPSASGNSPDPALQAELYQAFFQAWQQSGSSSLIGAYFWEWDPNGSRSNVGPNIDSFSPQNSPAQTAVTTGFESTASTIANGATLEISTPNSGSVTFDGPTGVLKLEDPQTFSGPIFNFTGNGNLASSDQIDLSDIHFGPQTTASYAGDADGGTLTVTDAQHDAASVELVGDYENSTFTLSGDGNGGTLVVDPPASGSVTIGGPGNDAFIFNPAFDSRLAANAASFGGFDREYGRATEARNTSQSLLASAESGHASVIDAFLHEGIAPADVHPTGLHANTFITH